MSRKQGRPRRTEQGPHMVGMRLWSGMLRPVQCRRRPPPWPIPLRGALVQRFGAPLTEGMRPSARAEGSLRSNGVPTGLLLARVAFSLRHAARRNPYHDKEEAA